MSIIKKYFEAQTTIVGESPREELHTKIYQDLDTYEVQRDIVDFIKEHETFKGSRGETCKGDVGDYLEKLIEDRFHPESEVGKYIKDRAAPEPVEEFRQKFVEYTLGRLERERKFVYDFTDWLHHTDLLDTLAFAEHMLTIHYMDPEEMKRYYGR